MNHQEELVEVLKSGGVAALRTDTLYGLVARADDENAVERIYELKGRDADKACIVLVADQSQLYDQPSVSLDDKWPGPVSLILPSPSAPEWLHRGGRSLAYRLPADPILRQLINQTGPLIAPSANPQGSAPARNIEQARFYFGSEVDIYVDGGAVPANTPPSQLWRLEADQWERLR